MKIYAISDLHLSGTPPTKPMTIFGEQWTGHWEKIQADWLNKVGPEDWVLLPGDLSWAMQFNDALADLEEIAKLPGKKVILRGNHDYWWQTLGKMQRLSPPSFHYIHNNYIELADSWAICGTRGWTLPDDDSFTAEDQAIYEREVQRLEFSLAAAKAAGKSKILLLLHYPPFYQADQKNQFIDKIEQYPVIHCIYGHLHSRSAALAYEGCRNNTCYHLVACDALNFQLKLIHEIDVQQ